MNKRNLVLTPLVLSLIILFSFTMTSGTFFTSDAKEILDIKKSCSLEIVYSIDNVNIENEDVRIYKIADISEDLNYTLSNEFSKYPISLDGINFQSEWNEIVSTLDAYISADQIKPVSSAITSSDGKALFNELNCGMYLVSKVNKVIDGTEYIFHSFLVAVPGINENGRWDYNVSVKPKFEKNPPSNAEIEYKAIKIWKDSKSVSRPAQVEIEIYKNGEKKGAQILNASNDWSYSWKAIDDGSEWNVVERNVPKGYTVSINKNATAFYITNTSPSTYTPPQTGDNTNISLYIVITAVSGAALIVLGIIKSKFGRKTRS